MNNNTSTATQYCCIILRSIFFARANCEDEECGSMPSMSAISLCDMPSNTDSRNTCPYPSGNWSIILTTSLSGTPRTSCCSVCCDTISASSIGTIFTADIRSLHFDATFLVMAVIQASARLTSRNLSSEVKIITNASCSTSSTVCSSLK